MRLVFHERRCDGATVPVIRHPASSPNDPGRLLIEGYADIQDRHDAGHIHLLLTLKDVR